MRTAATVIMQIEKLQKELEQLRVKERVAVVERIRAAILDYDISTDELFGTFGAAKLAKPRYTHEGKYWNGNGRCPGWLLEAMAESGHPRDWYLELK